MRNKLLIGAGILLTIFIVFLVIICGASSGGNNTLPEDDLKQIVYGVSCDVKDEESIDYDTVSYTHLTLPTILRV